jgi:hypothetical protein
MRAQRPILTLLRRADVLHAAPKKGCQKPGRSARSNTRRNETCLLHDDGALHARALVLQVKGSEQGLGESNRGLDNCQPSQHGKRYQVQGKGNKRAAICHALHVSSARMSRNLEYNSFRVFLASC